MHTKIPTPHSDTQARWEAIHVKHRALRRAIDAGRIDPNDRELAQAYPERRDLMRDLHHHWFTLLGGCIELALETGGPDVEAGESLLQAAQRAAYRRAPRLQALIHDEQDDATLGPLLDRSYRRLAQVAGLSGPAAGSRVAAILDAVVARPMPGPAGWIREIKDWFLGRERDDRIELVLAEDPAA